MFASLLAGHLLPESSLSYLMSKPLHTLQLAACAASLRANAIQMSLLIPLSMQGGMPSQTGHLQNLVLGDIVLWRDELAAAGRRLPRVTPRRAERVPRRRQPLFGCLRMHSDTAIGLWGHDELLGRPTRHVAAAQAAFPGF